jgi:predicted transcriptional regulator
MDLCLRKNFDLKNSYIMEQLSLWHNTNYNAQDTVKHRNSTEIIDSLLKSIGSGATKTHIMYGAYLSYTQLQEYLTLLQDTGLIRFDQKSGVFILTERATDFMTAYEEIEDLVLSTDEINRIAKRDSAGKKFG